MLSASRCDPAPTLASLTGMRRVTAGCSPSRKENMKLSKHRGFSLLEMMAVIAIGFILAALTITTFIPLTNQQHITEAYNSTLTTMRRARDQATADMRIYVVTFTTPGTITVTQTTSSTCQIPAVGTVLMTTVLPSDVSFMVEPGVPTSNTTAPTTPDAIGSAALAIDFDEPSIPGSTSICFNPDGTATDVLGNINNGVIYMGRTGDVYSARAITLWGTTGRLRGWRLLSVSSVNTWRQQ